MGSIHVKKADWLLDNTEIKNIRRVVFIEEQHVPENMEWDDEDKLAFHCLAYVKNQAVATGRILNNGHIGRMAVLKPFRRRGIGSKILKYLIEYHHSKSDEAIIIHAQSHALQFYQASGFIKLGNEFLEAGIPHYKMSLMNKKIKQ